MKRKVTIVTAWVLARKLAEETIDILDIKMLTNLFELISSGEIARMMRTIMGLEKFAHDKGVLNTREYLELSDWASLHKKYRLEKDQLEEIFVQSFNLVCSHFGYQTEVNRLRENFCPFRQKDSFNTEYFTDKVFEGADYYSFSEEIKYLKSFPLANYKKALIRKSISLDQAISISLMAASNVIWEEFQRALLENKDSESVSEEEIATRADSLKESIVDEVAWQLYKNYSHDYGWSKQQGDQLIQQANYLVTNFYEKLLHDRGKQLDTKRQNYKDASKGVHFNTTPSIERRREQTTEAPYNDKTYLSLF